MFVDGGTTRRFMEVDENNGVEVSTIDAANDDNDDDEDDGVADDFVFDAGVACEFVGLGAGGNTNALLLFSTERSIKISRMLQHWMRNTGKIRDDDNDDGGVRANDPFIVRHMMIIILFRIKNK